MSKFLLFAMVGALGFFSTVGSAEAFGRRKCCCSNETTYTVPAAPAATPPATAQAQGDTQVYRSYSYEPSTSTGYYSRSYRAPNRGVFDAGHKARGEFGH